MLKWYENYNGGINNLAVVKSNNIVTTSLKGMDTAVKNHKRKMKVISMLND
ncbi:hypothetical protein K144316041_p21640 (plasmid) [Clostridium tetani]|uniref:hypothetical protein n=1 Tax=Clostridium tetani TaxID=1513 RepID=UPI0029538BD2|nr:hypothetical protein [Clostridium tetani]BDR74325.1 hypothetical protein K144316041_p21640 [Clostridium tetani]